MINQHPDTLRLFEDVLKTGSSLRIRVTGRSMVPFLKGGEILTIRRVSYNSLRRGDLILFRSKYDSPVLHRIIRIKPSYDKAYIFHTKGDASRLPDDPVHQNEVMGKVCKVQKNSYDAGPENIDMESTMWKKINFLIALIHQFFKTPRRFDSLKKWLPGRDSRY